MSESKQLREFKIAYFLQIKSGALKGTYISWDGSPSTAFVKYIEFSAIESRDKQIAILEAALTKCKMNIGDDVYEHATNCDVISKIAFAEAAKLKEGK